MQFFRNESVAVGVEQFFKACRALKVKTRIKGNAIGNLSGKDWKNMIDTLQSFSNKLEKTMTDNPKYQCIQMDPAARIALIDRGIRAVQVLNYTI